MNLINAIIAYRTKLRFQQQSACAKVRIDPTSDYPPARIKLKPGCTLVIDEKSIIVGSIVFERPEANVSIGSRTFMNGSLISAEKIKIGDDVMIAWGTTIVDHNSHSTSFSKRSQAVANWRKGVIDWTHVKMAPVVISDKVWIGFASIILKGVTIGEGAVVGAGSVVTKDVAPWTIVAGNPARIIREIPLEER